jgi:uncharacterized metal-binding protein YceD (DUF177 family)
VNNLDQFLIPINGIKPGNYSFNFKIDDSFFQHFEYSEIRKGNVGVHIEMEKEEKLIQFHFTLDGFVTVHCDRCYEEMEQAINGTEELIVKFGSDFHEESEDVQIIPEGESQFNVSQFLYEYIHLLLPIRRVHPVDENGNSECDPEVIRRLEASPKPAEPDPRWEVLNKLKTKN